MVLTDLGMSTSWNSAGIEDGTRIVDEIAALGFKRLEIEYRVSENAIPAIEAAVRSGRITVSSVHNFAPLPASNKPSNWGGDTLSLSSPDEPERSEAVNLTLRSLELAKRLGARALILHMGEIDTGRGFFQELADVVKAAGVASGDAVRIRESVKKARDARKAAFLDSAVRSLKDLLARSEDSGITVCIENRYFHNQIPLPDEVVAIKQEIPSARLRYWHDLGHAHVEEVLGFSSHLEVLDRLEKYIFGVHIHDSVFIGDHKAPGTGEIDFSSVFAKINRPVIKVLELASSVSADDIRHATGYLSAL
ncbi:MAG: TIM barrel protein [Candidatus Eisenbacteria bacterium]